MGRRVVQVRPSQLDLLQLPKAVRTKSLNSAVISFLSRFHSELAIEALPGEPEWTLQCEGPVRQPQIEGYQADRCDFAR